MSCILGISTLHFIMKHFLMPLGGRIRQQQFLFQYIFGAERIKVENFLKNNERNSKQPNCATQAANRAAYAIRS